MKATVSNDLIVSNSLLTDFVETRVATSIAKLFIEIMIFIVIGEIALCKTHAWILRKALIKRSRARICFIEHRDFSRFEAVFDFRAACTT